MSRIRVLLSLVYSLVSLALLKRVRVKGGRS